jgi:hypothetical protein
MNSPHDIRATALHVILRTNGDRLQLGLRPDHMLEGRAKLCRQVTMSHQDHTDHWTRPSVECAALMVKLAGLMRGSPFCASPRNWQAKTAPNLNAFTIGSAK